MTQEIKNKLEQAAKAYFNGDGSDELSPFKAGAQTILENPEQWGLMPILESMDHIEESNQNWSEVVEDLKSQLTKYREVLERIIVESEDNEQVDWMYVAENMVEIAKEALNQEISND